MNYYHGTTDILDIDKYILPPIYTNILRESWRIKYRDKVFFTNSIMSAEKFAKKAYKKYGGNPVVYEVIPVGHYENLRFNEYIADSLQIERRL